MMDRIKEVKRVRRYHPHRESKAEDGPRNLIESLLKEDPQARLDLQDVLRHGWIVKNVGTQDP
jgi:hypothetical protein